MSKHRWEKEPKRLAASERADGNASTERACTICGMVKITVHPPYGLPWREWRTRTGGVMIGGATPRCFTIDGDASTGEKAVAG